MILSAAAGVGMWSRPCHAGSDGAVLRKALIRGFPDAGTLADLKAAGFEGMECQDWNVTPGKAAEAGELAKKAGVRIHSVMRGWCSFDDKDPATVDREIASMETALKAAQAYGADAVLLVPCRIEVRSMPQPWEFDIEFDEATCHVSRVVKGDNGPCREYMERQNMATDSSRKAIQRLIPVARETGVIIAIENVWNSLWVKPKLFASFVRSFNSPHVRAYFDIGNHVKFAPPEEWIRELGSLIAKCHVKDFKLNPDGHGGSFVNIREGSVNWPAVRSALSAVGYEGWMTIEGSGKLPLEEQNARLDRIIGGK
jgi:L-ribulose-5-phosphate 3-epimerase